MVTLFILSTSLLGFGLLGMVMSSKSFSQAGRVRDTQSYRDICQNIWDGILITDSNWIIGDCNPAFEDLLGYPLREIQGKDFSGLNSLGPGVKEISRFLQDHKKTRREHLVISFKTKSGAQVACKVGGYMQFGPQESQKLGYVIIFRDITKRLDYQNQLMNEQYMLALVTDSSPVGIMFLNSHGTIDYANRPAEQILGLSKKDITGRTYNDPKWKITDEKGHPLPEDQHPFVRATLTRKPVYDARHGVHLPSGEWKLLSINSEPIVSGGEEVKGVVATLTDITQQHETELDLLDKHQQLQVAYEAAEMGTWRHDMIQNTIAFNEKGLKHYGFSCSGVSLEEVFNRVHPDDAERLKQEFSETTAPESSGEFATQYRVYHDDGSLHWLQVHVRVKFEGEGPARRPIVGYGTSQDITAQKQSEVELKKLFKGVEQSPAIIIITDREGVIEYANPQFLKATGYSWEEVKGRDPNIVQSGQTPEQTYKEMWRAIEGGNTWTGEFINQKKNGEHYVFATSISPIIDDKGKITHYIGVGEDITRRRHNENVIQESLKEKTVLLSEVHHRVKNNLAIISGLLELQAMRTEQQREILQQTQNRIQSIAQVHELLYKTENFASIDIIHYINKLTGIIRDTYCTSNLDVVVTTDISDVMLNVNQAVPFGLMINELISNSYTHAFGGRRSGEINIALQPVEGNAYHFTYSDNGVGIQGIRNLEDLNNMQSLGLELINILSKQLGAYDYHLNTVEGFTYGFTFVKSNVETKGSLANLHV